MGVTRRVFLQSAVAATATGTAVLAGARTAGAAAPAASGPGDVVGKVTVGYQGWFACIGDGAPIDAWWHWSANGSAAPSPSNTGIVAWPDVRDYAHTYPTGYAALGNGQPAALFSSYDQQTVDTHFQWLQANGIDVAALQRFNPNGSEGPTRDAMAVKVRASAETYGRKFYVMYDVSDWTNMQSEIKADWTGKMRAHTASPAYAVQNGKPVVCVWGFGFADNQRPFTADACLDVVNWFKGQGCYVIGGVPTWWRTGDRDSRPGFSDVYHAFDMLSPWMVGRIGNVADADNFFNVATVPDLAECAAHGIDYQPCVLPGAVTLRQRAHGDFMWRQFYNMVRAGVGSVYISMFDEFNEGNQIAKTAESQAWVPANSGFLALDEDGTACSSDYYLRLTGDGGRMLKGQLALTATRPTPPVVGGGTTPPPTGDLALHRATSESSHTQSYGSANATDGDPSSYWESANNAFPQWIQVDLGAASTVRRLVLTLPPSAAWTARTQTLSVRGSTDGATFTALAGSAGHTFDPATGNTATVTLPAAATTRYLRLDFTANTGWPAAQLSGLQVFAG
ncbi:putative xylosidase/arabinosidase [Actinacidiphila reveromycinica]|uniref:Putative xylosidase/arabinosidase n=1 Tax=Actinacidiphila reveromycinica TaxID=659352 RepID=A0A7U3UZ80_9ACTN|nr:discoidin domain-containing protein [Streptomyces sp. SN-593]BBB01559.1 putative xylosidase/arabinosidase [Streptomyces sp. SN-593]